jgi:hypothetical protein
MAGTADGVEHQLTGRTRDAKPKLPLTMHADCSLTVHTVFIG